MMLRKIAVEEIDSNEADECILLIKSSTKPPPPELNGKPLCPGIRIRRSCLYSDKRPNQNDFLSDLESEEEEEEEDPTLFVPSQEESEKLLIFDEALTVEERVTHLFEMVLTKLNAYQGFYRTLYTKLLTDWYTSVITKWSSTLKQRIETLRMLRLIRPFLKNFF